MTVSGFLAYALGWITPQKKFSSIEWKRAKAAKNYSVMKSMAIDLCKTIIGKNNSESLTLLGEPDEGAYSEHDSNFAWYHIEKPGMTSKSVFVRSENSIVRDARVHPDDVTGFLNRTFPM